MPTKKRKKRVSIFRNGIDKVAAFCIGIEQFLLYLSSIFLQQKTRCKNAVINNV